MTPCSGATTLGTGSVQSGGYATYSTASLVAGSHAITAEYSGDANFTGSTATTYTQTVNGTSTP